MKKPCAICDETNSTTYVCGECEFPEASVDWVETPREERAGANYADHAAGDAAMLQGDKERYYTELDQRILRLTAFGVSRKEIAAALGCSYGHVRNVVSYWEGKTGGLLSVIIRARSERY